MNRDKGAKRSVLLIYRNKNIAELFSKHLRKNGYAVYDFYDAEIPYLKFSVREKLEIALMQKIFKERNYFTKVQQRQINNISRKNLKKLRDLNIKFDYCFAIRADLVPQYVIEYARTISGRMVDFQLDGIDVSKKILDYIKFFDDIYVFDPADEKKYPQYHFKTRTNCYFEEPITYTKSVDFSYIGVDVGNRFEFLEELYDLLKEINPNFTIKFYLKKNEFRPRSSDRLIMLDDAFSYEQCLKLSEQSKTLIDIKRDEHEGLSLRFFEAMHYRCKIITTNSTTKNYDFYDGRNILILQNSDDPDLSDFVQTPYREVDPKIRDKYNFKNWIRTLLEDKS